MSLNYDVKHYVKNHSKESLKKIYGRQLNKELDKLQKITKIDDPKLLLDIFKDNLYVNQRQTGFWNKFKQMSNPWIRCKECLKLIPNDWNLVQRHMMAFHIKDRAKYKEFGFDITPVPRIRRVII